MDCATKLAVVAVITALRRSGIVDKEAVRAIAETLTGLASQSHAHCEATARDLAELALMMREGPMKSCLASPPAEGLEMLLSPERAAVNAKWSSL